MKQVWILAFGMLVTSVTGAVAADTPAAFRAGAAKANITPPLGMNPGLDESSFFSVSF